MDIRIESIQLEFTKIITTTHEIKTIFDNLEIKIIKLKEIYQNLIKNNNDSKFMFGLDSFRFQGKLIDLELEEMKKYNILINNRLYCEYYKLYKIMKIDIQQKFTDKKILELTHKNYPVYKDLEIYKVYEFEIILEIHDNLIEILLSISHYLKNKDLEIHKYEDSNNIGFNINNFINTIKYETAMIKEQALLYLNYLEYFNNIYLKYFNRFITKIKIFYSQINNDIKLEDKNLKKNMLNNLESDNIDLDIINAIKNTLSEDKDSRNVLSLNSLDSDNNLMSYSNNENIIIETIVNNSVVNSENIVNNEKIINKNIINKNIINNEKIINNDNIITEFIFNNENENIFTNDNNLLDNFNNNNNENIFTNTTIINETVFTNNTIINETVFNNDNNLLDNFNNNENIYTNDTIINENIYTNDTIINESIFNNDNNLLDNFTNNENIYTNDTIINESIFNNDNNLLDNFTNDTIITAIFNNVDYNIIDSPNIISDL